MDDKISVSLNDTTINLVVVDNYKGETIVRNDNGECFKIEFTISYEALK